MKARQAVLCGVLLMSGVAQAVPVDCNGMTTLAQYIAQNAGGGCFVQDKLYTGFSYTGGGSVTAANVNVKVVFSGTPTGPMDIHGFVLTTTAGVPVWTVGFTWGYTISINPPNPSIQINSAKIQGDFGNLGPNPASATTTKGNGLVQSVSLGSETDIDSFASAASLTSSTTVTIPAGGFLIALDETYTQGPPAADLSLAKTRTPHSLAAGGYLTYTINLVNNGPDSAPNVAVTDVLPANTTFVSAAAPAGWTATTPPVGGTGTVTFTKGIVAASESATFTIVVRVGPSVPVGTIITNTATTSSSATDPNSANNTSTALASVAGCGPHTTHGHISTVPPSHSGNVSHEHHGQHGHTVAPNCPPHAPGHSPGLTEDSSGGLFDQRRLDP
jgi:uncharacterized repeat protein (TIGR01451 family)